MAFAKGRRCLLAKGDGTDARKLVTMKTLVSGLWSIAKKNGSRLQVETEEISQSGTSVVVGERSIWDVSADGSNPRPLISEWQSSTNECCGRWTADGQYICISVGGADLGCCGKKRHFLQRKAKSIQLTFSPMQLQSPLPSKDGKKLFVVGMTFRGELTSVDVKTGKCFA